MDRTAGISRLLSSTEDADRRPQPKEWLSGANDEGLGDKLTRTTPIFFMEVWLSGLRQPPGKRPYLNRYRRFESFYFRQFMKYLFILLPIIIVAAVQFWAYWTTKNDPPIKDEYR